MSKNEIATGYTVMFPNVFVYFIRIYKTIVYKLFKREKSGNKRKLLRRVVSFTLEDLAEHLYIDYLPNKYIRSIKPDFTLHLLNNIIIIPKL